MSTHVHESAAFVLHRRHYGETSRIISCFTRDYGRVDILCKGCRNAGKKSRVLEPFRRYELSWSGKSDLKTLRQADELQIYALTSHADRLYCGFYLNELLHGVIRSAEAEPDIFQLYDETLNSLLNCRDHDISMILRQFELKLLQYMGYGVVLDCEQDGITPIVDHLSYGFIPEQGLFQTTSQRQIVARGDSIMALQKGEFTESRHAQEAKQLTRFLIAYYLPNSSIQSRKLFN